MNRNGEPDSFYTEEDIRARLSISTNVFMGYRPLGQDALADLARAGITRIELLESPDQYMMSEPESMAFMARLFRDSGIEVRAYHAHEVHFDDIVTDAQLQLRLDLCRRQIDTMLELGGVLWACHARSTGAVVRRAYEALALHVESTPARVAIENFARPDCSVEERVGFLDSMDHPKVGMILDIGHVRDALGANPMTITGGATRVVGLCGHRLCHVHLHGFIDGVDHHAPLCEGDEIQWLELFQALYRSGYDGDMNFEPKGPPRFRGSLEHTARAPEAILALHQRA
jgi:sugar phosphate isomerase/epimerase